MPFAHLKLRPIINFEGWESNTQAIFISKETNSFWCRPCQVQVLNRMQIQIVSLWTLCKHCRSFLSFSKGHAAYSTYQMFTLFYKTERSFQISCTVWAILRCLSWFFPDSCLSLSFSIPDRFNIISATSRYLSGRFISCLCILSCRPASLPSSLPPFLPPSQPSCVYARGVSVHSCGCQGESVGVWCEDVCCREGSCWASGAELLCLAPGHLSWAISVLTACWSQVVGCAYHEDQRISVSPSSSLPPVSLWSSPYRLLLAPLVSHLTCDTESVCVCVRTHLYSIRHMDRNVLSSHLCTTFTLLLLPLISEQLSFICLSSHRLTISKRRLCCFNQELAVLQHFLIFRDSYCI